jgi:regulator of protease activity HflC (stomatin/prohibitin superfamily)
MISESSEENRKLETEQGPVKPPIKDDPNFIKNILLGSGIIFGIALTFQGLFRDGLTAFSFLLMVFAYIFVCLKNISPEEKGIRITLWTPEEDYVYTGGLYWRWFPFQWFYLFPTEQVIIDIPPQKVITSEKKIGEKVYSEADITVNAVLYFFWPSTPKGLCKAYRRAPSPFDLEKLHKFFKPSMAATVRRVAGRFSWLEVRASSEGYVDDLHKEIRENIRGPVVKSGITDFNVENELVKLPPGLEETISLEQQSIYRLEAGKKDAELERIKRAEAGKGDAEARRQILTAMKETPEMAIVLMYEEMAKGPASTIFYELPRELKDIVREGSEIPDELRSVWKTIPKPERTAIAREFVNWLQTKKK